MKIAAALAIANIAKLDVPKSVSNIYGGKQFQFGREYIIPTPFDPRLLYEVSSAVARAAMESGVARREITDWNEYRHELKARIAKTTF